MGARRVDIIRQFLLEAMLISIVGGLIGIVFGFGMSRVIALLAGWSTIVTLASILLAFLVSVTVGLIFGTYPAVKAARSVLSTPAEGTIVGGSQRRRPSGRAGRAIDRSSKGVTRPGAENARGRAGGSTSWGLRRFSSCWTPRPSWHKRS